ncbi:MAG: hypothetical protein OEW48_11290 [Phycisphaerae bacterium]|nr:hypothetical protein [Phycisphaerae bacterium]
MNKRQKICLFVGTALFAVLGLFPRCWVSAGSGTNPLPRRWFILNNSRAFVIRNHTYFYVQQAVIGLTTVGLVLALRDKNPTEKKDDM